MLRILIADDHEFIRLGIRSSLEPHSDWQVCDEATTGIEAVSKTEQWHPDILILDIGMPGLNGIEAAKQIRQSSPNQKFLFCPCITQTN